jgi:DNA-directed RNA polymerase subunit M/transcription elongation factor TFIIS
MTDTSIKNITKFCPDCNTILSYKKTELSKLCLICNRCGYTDESDIVLRFEKTNNEKKNTFKYALPTEYTKFDKTLLKTTHIQCQNPECPTIKEELNEDNLPEVLLTNKSNINRIMNMTCAVCSYTW